MITVAIIATVAAIALPKLTSARVSANENAAITTLQTLTAAQAQFTAGSMVDSNADGGGEFGFFGELAGTSPLRIYDALVDGPVVGGAADTINVPILPTPFGDILVDDNGEGIVTRSGYYYKMWLPGTPVGNITPGVAEAGKAAFGGADPANMPAPGDCEILWACYAWPVDAGKTGNRAFFVNQEGDTLQFLNSQGTYTGTAAMPTFDAAYSDGTGGGDMNARMGITAAISVLGEAANDGNTWTVTGS